MLPSGRGPSFGPRSVTRRPGRLGQRRRVLGSLPQRGRSGSLGLGAPCTPDPGPQGSGTHRRTLHPPDFSPTPVLSTFVRLRRKDLLWDFARLPLNRDKLPGENGLS